MTWNQILVSATLGSLIAGCSGGADIDNEPPAPGEIGDGQLASILEYVRTLHGVPAVATVVVQGDDVAELAAVGVRREDDADPVGLDDRWHLGSLTKAMTATLVGRLVEDGLLEWTTTPVDVWPEQADEMQAYYRSQTVSDLLAHTAGLPSAFRSPSLDAVSDDAPGTVTTKRQRWSEALLALAPINTRQEFAYSDAGYIVVGSMLETLSGQSWEALMREHIFAPLSMTHSGFGPPGERGRCAQACGHRQAGDRLIAVPPGPDADNPAAIGPSASVHAPIRDYAAFMATHLAGAVGRQGLVRPSTFAKLHSPHRGGEYAMGWFTSTTPVTTDPILTHAGTNGLWRAQVGVVPEFNFAVLIVANAAHAGTDDAFDALSVLLFERTLASM